MQYDKSSKSREKYPAIYYELQMCYFLVIKNL